MTLIRNPHPRSHIDPLEKGLAAGYNLDPSELVHFGRYINVTGATYDLVTPTGSPLIGQGGGIYVPASSNSYWSGAVYALGVAMSGEHEIAVAPTADSIVVQNGAQHLARDVKTTGRFEASLNSGAVYSTADWDFSGRGPFHWAVTYSGTNQNLWINRRLVDSDAVALGVPAGNIQIGRFGTTRSARFYNTQPNVAKIYLDFARNVLFHWTPDDGESSTGIATGQSNNEWRCISGGASLKFEWVHSNKWYPNGTLAFTDTIGGVNNRGIVFSLVRPRFGSIYYEYLIRDPATDSSIVEISAQKIVGAIGASTGIHYSYGRTTGGVWRVSWAREAGGFATNVDTRAVVAGDKVGVLWCPAIDGNWRLFASVNGMWYGSDSTVASDVTYLNNVDLGIFPGGSKVTKLTWYQGEMTPGELNLP